MISFVQFNASGSQNLSKAIVLAAAEKGNRPLQLLDERVHLLLSVVDVKARACAGVDSQVAVSREGRKG